MASEFHVVLQENILAPKSFTSGTPKQFALRIASLLLHPPDYIETADKHGLGKYCTDEFTMTVWNECHNGHLQMKQDKRWSVLIKKILHPSGLNHKIISANSLKGEFEAIIDWKKQLEVQDDLIGEANKISELLGQGILPEI